MSTQPQVAPPSPQDEIDQIMDELEQIQGEMESPTTSEKPDLKVVPEESEGAENAESTEDTPKADSAESKEAAPTDVPETAPEPTPEASESVEEPKIEDFHGDQADAPMEESVGQMKGIETEGDSLLDLNPGPDSGSNEVEEVELGDIESELGDLGEVPGDVSEEASPVSSDEAALTLSLQGSMKLKLKYEMNGKEVTIGFSGDHLKVELKDGTEFKVPVRK